MPAETVQKKMNIFYPTRNQGYSKYMKFETDEKIDVINKLQELYKSPSSTVEDKIVIAETIHKIQSGTDQPGSGSKLWRVIYDWIYKT